MKNLPFTLLAFVSLAIPALAEPNWTSYLNERFGFKLSYPAELEAGHEPPNGAGREFHSANGDFSLATSAYFLNGDSLEKSWKEELKDLEASVTYKKKAATWYVISGVMGDTEYYHKSFAKGQNGMSMHITYPHAKKEQYDAWVTKIEKSLVPFLKGDFDRAEN